MSTNNKFYVTTPIYYANSKPHLGTLYSTLLADVTARWNKILGKEVFFLTGTDEHGQKVGEAAKAKELDPKVFVDGMVEPFKKVWKRYKLDYDKFIRTTDEDHKAAVAVFINKLMDKGDIYKSTYVGFYCTPCETFIPDHAVEKDNPTCESCQRSVQEVTEENYFFRLSAYEDRLLEFFEKNPNFITPKERVNEVISFVKSGLKDLSISRKGVSWGIPFPGDAEHTVYVWCDALTNYISAIGFGSDEQKMKDWWPAGVHVLAKDIVRFHAIYWPAFLMAAELEMPKKMLVHGFLLMDGLKMSKSRGNVLDPLTLADWYGVEQIRYVLMRHMSVGQDCHVTLKDMESTINADLCNNLGNLVNRMLSLAAKHGISHVNPPEAWEADSGHMKELCAEAFRDYWDEMNHYHYHVALGDLWKFIKKLNAYFHSQQPWVVAKQNPELFKEILSVVCHSLYSVSVMLWPVMPDKMEELLGLIGCSMDVTSENYAARLRKNEWNQSFDLSQPGQALFPRLESQLEPEEAPAAKAQPEKKSSAITGDESYVTIDDVFKVELHVGQITSCEPVDGSKKLYKMQVDLGKVGKRQILAGIAQYYQADYLVGKKATFITNLKPRKLMGLVSEGMMLCAKDDAGNFSISGFDREVEVGTKLS